MRAPAVGTGALTAGVLAGLAGSSALNAVAYLDMTIRARPASSTPEETARRLTEVVGVGLGPLLGYLTAVSSSVTFTLLTRERRMALPVAAGLLGAVAMLAADTPMTVLGVTDPRRWRPVDWVADLVPHLAFGAAAALTLRRLRPTRR